MPTTPSANRPLEEEVKDGSSIVELSKRRLEELETFLIALNSPVLKKEAEEDDVFNMLVQLAVDDYGVSQGELADVLHTQSSTVGRWKQGRAFPSVYSRPGILDGIAVLLSRQISDRRMK